MDCMGSSKRIYYAFLYWFAIPFRFRRKLGGPVSSPVANRPIRRWRYWLGWSRGRMNYWLVQLLTDEPEADRCRIEGSELTGGRADTNNGHSLLLGTTQQYFFTNQQQYELANRTG